VALLFGACGGKGSDDASTTTVTTTAPTTTVPGPGGKFCDLVRSYTERLSGLGPSLVNPEALRKVLEEAGPLIDEAEALAPPEVAPDIRVLAVSSRKFLGDLRGVNFDYTKLPPEAFQQLQTPEIKAAQGRLQTYIRDVCRVGPQPG
jgi:hypothetical protein